jgi:hypothetical protein
MHFGDMGDQVGDRPQYGCIIKNHHFHLVYNLIGFSPHSESSAVDSQVSRTDNWMTVESDMTFCYSSRKNSSSLAKMPSKGGEPEHQEGEKGEQKCLTVLHHMNDLRAQVR